MELGSAKLQATEEEQRNYPFLPRRVDDVLMSDLRLAEDGVFQELVARRDALVAAGPGSNPELLTATERQLRGRASELAAAKKAVDAFRTDEDEAVRARNPFLESNEVKLVPLREFGLPSDPTYAALANERLQLMQSPVRNAAAIAATEEALRGRVEELALARAAAEDVLLAKYPFFAALPGAVLLANEDIKRSPLFATLAARYEELAAQPEVDESELETVKDALLQSAARLLSEEKEAEQAAAEARNALHAQYPMCARDVGDAVAKDPTIAGLIARRSELLKDPVGNADAIADVDNILHRRGLEVEAARKRRGKPLQPDGLFAFDDVEPDDREVSDYRARRQRQRHARQLHACIIPEGETGEIIDEDAQLSQKPLIASSVVKSDPYFQELGVLRDALVVEGREVNAPAIQCVEEQMRRRMQQLRSDERKAAKAEARREQWLLEQHPYLDGVALAGLPLSKLGLSEDEEFTRLAEEHTVLAASPEKNAEALAAKEQCLKARAAHLAAAVVRQEAALREQMPYLMHLPFDVALRELHLESNPEFVALLAKHAALCEDPDRAGGAEAKRLERAMRDLAKRIAEDVVEARRRALVETENLHEKYPCLPEEPAPGVAIVEVGLVEDPVFRALSHELDGLRADPTKNAEQIAATERAVRARAMELGSAKLQATEEEQRNYPFLPRRVDDVLMSDLRLAEDGVFQELVARRDALVAAGPGSNPELLTATERQLRGRASELAAAKKAVDAFRTDEDEAVRARNPFLESNEVKLVPLREFGLPSDPTYAALANERLQLMQSPVRNAAAIAATEEALRGRVEELALARAAAEDVLLAKYPFFAALPGAVLLANEDIKRSPLFATLAARYEELAAQPEVDESELETVKDALLQSAARLLSEEKEAEQAAAEARNALHAQYPMCARDVGDAVAKDPTIAGLIARRSELLKDPVGNADAIADVNNILHRRGLEVEAARKRRGKPLQPDGLFAFDDVEPDDREVSDYRARRQRQRHARQLHACIIPEGETGEIIDEDAQLSQKPLIASSVVKSDPYFQELGVLRDALVVEGREVNAPAIQCVEEQMRRRMQQLRSDERKAAKAEARREQWLLEQHPYLDGVALAGLPLSKLGLSEDEEFTRLAEEHTVLAASPEKNAEALAAKEQCLKARAAHLAAAVVRQEAALREQMPYLMHLPFDVALRELHLESNPEFVALLAKHAALCEDPDRAGGAEAKRLERAMRDLAKRIAEDVVEARRRALVETENLHEKHPCLPEEPAPGVAIVEVGLVEDPVFRALSHELDGLRADPTKNAEQIAATERAVRARAMELGSAKLQATEEEQRNYPFLPRRVDDVLMSDLRLAEDGVFQELVARRDALVAAGPGSNPELLTATERQLRGRASELAAAKKAVDAFRTDEDEAVRARNPFLESNEVKLVPLREFGLPSDPTYAALANERLQLMQSPVRNAAAIAATEEALRGRVEELALARAAAEDVLLAKYPFFAALPGAVLLANEDIKRSPLFATLAARYEELAAQPEVDESELETVKDALLQSAARLLSEEKEAEQAAAEARNALHAQYPMCARDVGDAVAKDPTIAGLIARRSELLKDPVGNADAIADVDNILHRRGLEVEAARKRRGKPLQPDGLFAFDDVEPDDREVSDYRARRQRQRHARQLHACIIPEGETGEIIDEDAQLSQKPLIASSVVKSDPYFQELGVLRDALVVEGREVNAPAIQCVEEQMRRRMQQLRSDERKAAKAEARREQWLLEQHPYLDGVALAGLPLSKLGLSEDEEFTRLAEEHTVLAASPEKNAETLAAKEQCLKARAAHLAAAVVRQEAALREQMPYLMHLPFDVALRELHLESNPEFVALLAKHAALCEDPDRAGGAEAKRLERAMRDLAKRIAEDVVEARRRALVETENLHEKHPCLPEEPAPGVAIVEVGLVEDPVFRALSHELDGLRADPTKNAEQIAATERAVRARAMELGSAKLQATEEEQRNYPFLPRRVDDVLMSDLRLAEDGVFQELVARRDALVAAGPGSNPELLTATERQLRGRASELAAAKKAVDAFRTDEDEAVRARNPFLESNEVKLVPLRLVSLEEDRSSNAFQRKRYRALALGDAFGIFQADADLIRRFRLLADNVFLEEESLRAGFGYVGSFDSSVGSFLCELNLHGDECVGDLLEMLNGRLGSGKSVDSPGVLTLRERIKLRVDELRASYDRAEREVANELQSLRREFPTCIRDANPALRSDDVLCIMERTRQEALAADDADVRAVELIENEQLNRSIFFINDERCVFAALEAYSIADEELKKACDAKCSRQHIKGLSSERDVAQYKHRLWRARQNRRRLHLKFFTHYREGDEEVTVSDEETLFAAKAASTLSAEDSYYLYLQQCKTRKLLGAPSPAVRCLTEMMKGRVLQLNTDVTQAQLAENRVESELQKKYFYLHVPFGDLSHSRIPFEQDADFMRLVAERQELLTPPKELLQRFPFLSKTINGTSIAQLGLMGDPIFTKLAAEREELLGPLRTASRAVNVKEKQIRERWDALVSNAINEENELRAQWPHLMHLPFDVTLRELHLESNPEFVALLAKHAALCEDPDRAGGAEAKRLERAMRDLAKRIAEDVVEARRRALVETENLHEKHPCLPEEPAPGVAIVEVGLVEDPVFRALSHELDGLRADPTKNAEQIAATERAVRARAMELGSAKLQATEEEQRNYPFLPRRVDDVLMSDLRLAEDGVFQELVARRDALVAAGPGSNPELLTATERQLRGRASELAAAKKAVDAFRTDEDEAVRARNPFLESNEVKLVPLRFLNLMDDAKFRDYYKKRLATLGVEEIDLERLRMFDELLCGRAEIIAERQLKRYDSIWSSMRKRGLSPDLQAAFPFVLLMGSDAMEKALDSLGTGDDLDVIVRRMGETQALAERGIATELNVLRAQYPMCVRDLNPAVAFDTKFQRLETKRLSLLQEYTEVELIESLEEEERNRGVELLLDERYVVASQKACEKSKNKGICEMTAEELTSLWRHQLLARRSSHRAVSFLEVTNEDWEDAQRPSVRQRRKRSNSCTSASTTSFIDVPDNTPIEIMEENELLHFPPCSNRTSRIFSSGTSRAEFPVGVDENKNLAVSSNERKRVLMLRRLRNRRASRYVALDGIEDIDAADILESGAASQSAAESGGSGNGMVDVHASALRWRGPVSQAAKQTKQAQMRKETKYVVRRRMKLRHGHKTSFTHLAVSSIPDLPAGELVETGTENLNEGSNVSRNLPKHALKQQPEKPRLSNKCVSGSGKEKLSFHSFPRKQRRKSASTSTVMFPAPEEEGVMLLNEGAPEAPPPHPSDTVPRRKDSAREAYPLVSPVRDQEKSREPNFPHLAMESRPSPGCTLTARVSMTDVRLHSLSVSDVSIPTPPLRLPKIYPVPSGKSVAEESVAKGASTSHLAKRPSERKRRLRMKQNNNKSSLVFLHLEEDTYGEIRDTMKDEFPSAGRGFLDSNFRPPFQGSERSARRLRTISQHRPSSIEQLDQGDLLSVQDDVTASPTKTRRRRLCSFGFSKAFPSDRREARELERERRLISEVLLNAQQYLSRSVTAEEIECDSAAMALVFKYDEISQAFAMRRAAIVDAFLKEIFSSAVQRVIDMSKEPNLPGLVHLPPSTRQQRRQKIVRGAETLGGVSKEEMDSGVFPVTNPRCVPQPWAHISNEELAQDRRLYEMLNARPKESGENIVHYLREWSERKEAENEEIFGKYPFLSPLPHGVPLSELRLYEDAEFQREAAEYEMRREDVKLETVLRGIVDRLAKQQAVLRGRENPQHLSLLERLRAACGDASPSAAIRTDARVELEVVAPYKRSTFREESLRLQFIAQCKRDSVCLLRRLMVRMKNERTADIPLSIEDIETFRFFFDGVDCGNFGVLDRGDFVDFVMLTICDELSMSRREVENLAFPTAQKEPLPCVVDFSDFSMFYKSLALREVKRQDSRFCEETGPSPVRGRYLPPAKEPQKILGAVSKISRGVKMSVNTTALSVILPSLCSQSTCVDTAGGMPLQRRPLTSARRELEPQKEMSLPVILPTVRGNMTQGTQAWVKNSCFSLTEGISDTQKSCLAGREWKNEKEKTK
ncbi:hypothetical protein C3747_197g45 [Trypanosoma cruzi]|uniref:DUF7623 domain-containing protein n=1 Tax=Trypanosoma cruzi TaxID=5693 RepID=A0A2V2W3U7_TRYCR|nr:hypothetical protein C3747_197g45 [Trypanosoma cruzi]